jgi:hypothetical protein
MTSKINAERLSSKADVPAHDVLPESEPPRTETRYNQVLGPG